MDLKCSGVDIRNEYPVIVEEECIRIVEMISDGIRMLRVCIGNSGFFKVVDDMHYLSHQDEGEHEEQNGHELPCDRIVFQLQMFLGSRCRHLLHLLKKYARRAQTSHRA